MRHTSPYSDDQADLARGLRLDPPRIVADAEINGSSWSGCRKTTMPLAKLNPRGLLRLKRRQRWERQLVPRSWLRLPKATRQQRANNHHHAQRE